METIYRIEDANHVGCYARGFVVCTTGDHHGPDNDPILGQWWKKDNLSRTKQSEWLIERKAWFCGFRNMEELHNWLSQIMFKRDMATVCHRIPINVTEEI